MCLSAFNGVFWVGVIETDFHASTPRRVFRQKTQKRVGMVRAIAVQLEHLIAVGDDGEISRRLKDLHVKDGL